MPIVQNCEFCDRDYAETEMKTTCTDPLTVEPVRVYPYSETWVYCPECSSELEVYIQDVNGKRREVNDE